MEKLNFDFNDEWRRELKKMYFYSEKHGFVQNLTSDED